MIWLLIQNAFWAGIAALGFAMVFNAPVRTLPGCALCGAVGYSLRRLLVEMNILPIELATLVGAAAVGFLGLTLARRRHVPAPIFAVSGTIPMVPGVFGFRAMMGFVQVVAGGPDAGAALLVEASVNAIKTLLIVGAIAVGIAIPSLLFMRRKPVV